MKPAALSDFLQKKILEFYPEAKLTVTTVEAHSHVFAIDVRINGNRIITVEKITLLFEGNATIEEIGGDVKNGAILAISKGKGKSESHLCLKVEEGLQEGNRQFSLAIITPPKVTEHRTIKAPIVSHSKRNDDKENNAV